MATLIERLHDEAGTHVSSYSPRDHVTLEAGLLVEAADRIEQLEREAENMRSRLKRWEPQMICQGVSSTYLATVAKPSEPRP